MNPRTIAYDILRDNVPASGSVDVAADGWFGHRDAGRYAVREDSVRISSESVLTLIWWKDERQLLDLEEDEASLQALYVARSAASKVRPGGH